MRKKRISAVSLILVLVILLVTACGPSAQPASGKPTIKIGYLPITHAGPLFMDAHLHNGDHGNYKVELVKFNSWPDLMDALNTGRIEGASVLIQLAMKAKEKGIDLKALALGHKDGNVLITSKDIQHTQDLEGKTFAIPHKFSTHNQLLYETLKKEGMSKQDVNIVEMTPAEMPAALAGNQIAGYIVAEPFGAIGVNMDKGHVLHYSEEIWPNSYCCVFVLRNDFIQNNQAVTQDLVNQYIQSGELTNQKDETVHEAFANYMNLDSEVLDLSLQWTSFEDLRIEKAEYDKLRDLVVEMKLMEKPPTYEEFIDHTFIDKVM